MSKSANKIVAVCDKIDDAISAIVDESMELEKTGDVPDILRFYESIRSAYEALDAAKKRLGSTVDIMSKKVIPEAMGNAGVKTITMEDIGYRFTVSQRYFCSMPNKEDGMEWLRKNGAGDLIQPTVNSGTLSSWAKNRLEEEGLDLPENLFNVTLIPTTSMTKAK